MTFNKTKEERKWKLWKEREEQIMRKEGMSQDVLSLMKITSQRYGQTMVMITHNEEIAQLSDRIIRIEDGKITGKGGEAYA